MMNSTLPWAPGRSPHERLLTQLAVSGINIYQRHLSPRKGFGCAYRVQHQAESCSHYVKRVVLEEGVFGARRKVEARFAECREAHLTLRAMADGNAQFGDAGWLTGVGHGALQAGSFCIPTPIGCCWFSG